MKNLIYIFTLLFLPVSGFTQPEGNNHVINYNNCPEQDRFQASYFTPIADVTPRVLATAQANIRYEVTDVFISNSDATVGTNVFILDGITPKIPCPSSANYGGCVGSLHSPMMGTENTSLGIKADVTSAEVISAVFGCKIGKSTPTYTATYTPTNTPTVTQTSTVTRTFTVTVTPTSTATNTRTPTNTPTVTNTVTRTHTATPTHTSTRTPSYTFTPRNTHTFTRTPTATITNTPTVTNTFTRTSTVTPTFTNTP